jgi:Immunoglobulin-like domain of bacterial spore germination/Sporulation and spore germination
MNAEDRLRDMVRAAHTDARATDAEWNGFVRGARRRLYSRRASVIAGAAALVVVGAFAAVALSSGDDPARDPLPPAASSSPSPEPSPSPTPPPEPETVDVASFDVEEWYVFEERLSWGWTTAGGEIPRALASDDEVSQRAAVALRNLLGVIPGPVAETGNTTAIPDAAKLLHVARDGSVLEVDLSKEFESGGGSLSMQLRVAQVVYGGTQFEGIDAVRILIEGERVDAIGGEGLVVSEPLRRRDFQDVSPSIVVESPKIGQEISSGFEVTGFANVFEANVSIRITDEKDKVLVETFTTATCGTGCWGDFSKALEFDVSKRQQGLVQVFTFSAEDGSEQDMIVVPVTLVP